MAIDVGKALNPGQARTLINQIRVAPGLITFTRHALEEMDKDELTPADIDNVLRGGRVQHPELEKGQWRYRVATMRMVVVVYFVSEGELKVVTAWRTR